MNHLPKLPAFIQAHLPVCPFADWSLEPIPGEPSHRQLVITCTAPAKLRILYHAGSSLCPHAGPYLEPKVEAFLEAQSCPVLAYLRVIANLNRDK